MNSVLIATENFLLFAQETAKTGSWDTIIEYVGMVIYGVLGLIALWGAYCVVMALARVKQKRFKSEDAQNEFLRAVEEPIMRGDYDSAVLICEGDSRAMCQLTHLVLINRQMGLEKAKQLAIDRFQRDVLADLDDRLTWVNTVVKSAPMVGLLGTVLGMMGAFGKLATADTVDASQLAENIQLALITTASGLSIAIPLLVCIAFVNMRIRRMEDLVGAGLTQFFESLKTALARKPS